MHTVLSDKVKDCDRSTLNSKTKLHYIGSLVWLSYILKYKYCFTHQKTFKCFIIKSSNERILCTCRLVRGFILKDTQEMLKLQWMLLIWSQYDWKQVISLSILAEKCACLTGEIGEPPELKCCAVSDVHLTSIPHVLCCCSNLLNGRQKINKNNTCCWHRLSTDTRCVSCVSLPKHKEQSWPKQLDHTGCMCATYWLRHKHLILVM